MEQEEHIFRFLDEVHKLREHTHYLLKLIGVLLFVSCLKKSREQIQNMLQDSRVYHAYDIVVLIVAVLVAGAVE